MFIKDKMGYALVPKKVVENKLKIRFMYRELPDNDNDSGWRFFCGSETDEYVNNPDNIGVFDINTIIEIDSDIIPLLHNPIGSVFEREDENAPFIVSEIIG